MIEISGYFSEKEKLLIGILNQYFDELSNNVIGKVINRADFVRYEINIGEQKKELILQFCIRDHEDVEGGCCNFVHISNILVPYDMRRSGIAKSIISLMSKAANDFLQMPFFITGIVNDDWKESLIFHGGIEDDSGDIEIKYDRWRKLNSKYGIAYLNKDGLGYSDTEPYLYDCCCIEELKIILRTAKAEGYRKVIPFQYDKYNECCTWDYVEKNKIDVNL